MITKNTVLVLGAGASAPYGFPSGAELVKRICADLRSGATRNEIEKILDVHHFGGDFDYFLDTLARSGQLSIDAFLEHNREFLAMGKQCRGVTSRQSTFAWDGGWRECEIGGDYVLAAGDIAGVSFPKVRKCWQERGER